MADEELRCTFNLYTKRATIALRAIMTTPATIPPIAPAVNDEDGDGDGEVVAVAVNLTPLVNSVWRDIQLLSYQSP